MADVAAVDPLDLVLQHASVLDQITYSTESGEAAPDLLSSSLIHFPSHRTPLSRALRTRVLRSRNSPALAQDSTSTPNSFDDASHAEDFLPLDALIFILQTQAEAVGLYAVKATRERVARVDTLDRPSLLEFLLGKKTECEVVLSKAECAARDARRPSRQAAAAGAEAGATADATSQDASAAAVPSSAEASGSAIPLHPLLASGKRPYNPSKQDQAFVKRLRTSEVILRDRAWAFRCTVAKAGDGADDDDDSLNLDGATKGAMRSAASKEVDFTPLRRSVAGRIQAARSGGSSSSAPSSRAPPGQSSSVAAPSSNLGRSAKHRRLDPIFILPSSPSSLLTLANIKRFLEEGHYDPPSSSNSLAPMGGSNEVVVISRPKGGRFLAVDSLDALSRLGARGGSGQDADPWRRVVCVVTTGQKWQFKGYRWEEGRDLFRNVFGVYPRWSNEAKDGNVKEWNVLDLQIDANKRHHDAQISGMFWRQLEAWMGRRRPDLA